MDRHSSAGLPQHNYEVYIIKLFFQCPVTGGSFDFEDYSLKNNYRVVEDGAGNRELKGTVLLNSGCPLCGEKHQFDVKDVLCPLTRDNNDE